MKSNKIKKLLIEELKKKPVIESACQRAGVGRTAFYEWRKKDPKFAQAVNLALRFGRDFICDIAEMQLFNAIKAGDFKSIALLLKTYKPEYRNRLEIDGNITNTPYELTPKQRAIVEEALRRNGLINLNPQNHDESTTDK